MLKFLRIYQKVLNRRPFFVHTFQTGFLMCTGDIIAQNLTPQNNHKAVDLPTSSRYDYRRSFNFLLTGTFVIGPSVSMWYRFLNHIIATKSKTSIAKKLILDQMIFAPCLIATLLTILKTLDGQSKDEILEFLRTNYLDLLVANYSIWPLVQCLNFSIVPLNYQPLFVQTVALFWNVFISFKTNQTT